MQYDVRGKDKPMQEGILWGNDLETAVKEAEAAQKPILISFVDPQCAVCRRMETDTFADAQTIDFLNDNFITVQLSVVEPSSSASDFSISCTPSFVVMDSSEKEYCWTSGFLDTEDLISYLTLAIAKIHFAKGNYNGASVLLDRVIADCPEGASIPEAIFYRGLCKYMNTKNVTVMKEVYDLLLSRFPQSEWTLKASAYKTLQAD